jgi:hypothetical protein
MTVAVEIRSLQEFIWRGDTVAPNLVDLMYREPRVRAWRNC